MYLRLAAATASALRIWALTTCRFGGEDPVIGQPWHHEQITKEAAAAAGWSTLGGDASPVACLAWHCDYVDSYNYNPLWWAGGGWSRFHVALLHKSELDKLHFDDMTSTQQIAVMWNRYLGGTVAGLLWAVGRNDVPAARNIVGACLHALQDFYSHSNWVDVPARRNVSWADQGRSTVPVVNDARLALQLYTGAYNTPEQLTYKPHGKYSVTCSLLRRVPSDLLNAVCAGISPLSNTTFCREWAECKEGRSARIPVIRGVAIPEGIVYMEPAGMALDAHWMKDIAAQVRDLPDRDHLTDDLFAKARGLAVQGTVTWLRELDATMARAGLALFWNRVKTEVSSTAAGTGADLQQYEQPWRVPFGFLSAGAYPPDARGGDEGWHLRVELSTVNELNAGTDADISLEVAAKSFLLDHMHERTPQGGIGENRLLEWNDFEAGSRDTYLVGPVATLPTPVVLRNRSATFWDVLRAAWDDLVDWVSSTLEGLGPAILAMWGGNADYVGRDQANFLWDQLIGIAGRPFEQVELHVDGGDEGEYMISLTVQAVAAPGDSLQVDVRATNLHCQRESRQDQGTHEDEPFFFLVAYSPLNRDARSCTCGPFSGVDSGENRTPSAAPLTVTVPRYGGLIITAQVWESDEENQRMRDDAERAFKNGFNPDDVSERSAFLDAAGRMIAPDWKVGTLDVRAFRRGASVQLAPLVRNRALNTWVAGNSTLTIPCDPPQITTAVITSAPLPAGVVFAGTTVIGGTCTFDLDFGASGGGSGTEADLWWEQVDSTTRNLVPQRGAALARLGGVGFDALTAAALANQGYSGSAINGSNNASNELTVGTVLAVRTSKGNLAKVKIDSYGYNLGITWVTYAPS